MRDHPTNPHGVLIPCATCGTELHVPRGETAGPITCSYACMVARRERSQGYGIEVVYVGSAGHLRRYKVVDSRGVYVPGGLFRTLIEAEAFIAAQTEEEA